MKIYLAAPLFNEEERQLNCIIADRLRNEGHQVYCPQEYAQAANEKTSRKIIFENDKKMLDWCDCSVAILNGIVTDPGVCFELGYLTAQNKKILGYSTDSRSFINGHLNAMIEVSLFCEVNDLNALSNKLNERNN